MPYFFFLLNIASMRSVTMKPPTTLIVATTIATNPSRLLTADAAFLGGVKRADQGDTGDGVGARHQRSVQCRRDLGDDLEADEDRQHEDVQSDQKCTH